MYSGGEEKSNEKSSDLHFSVASMGTVCGKQDREDREHIQRVSVSVKNEPRNVIKCILKGPKKLYI